MRFDIRYRTLFRYDRPVRDSHNELRACPMTDEHQKLLSYRVTVNPTARVHSFTDYWGTRVDTFGVRAPHRELEIIAEAAVETSPRPAMTAAPQAWELTDPAFVRSHLEELEPTELTAWDTELAGTARGVADAYGDDVVGIVLGIHRLVRTSVQYGSGATDIDTPAAEVWQRGIGVCQDHAHVAIALCRSIGIPARYVSGYLFSQHLGGRDPAGAEDLTVPETTVEVQTHAWFEAALPGAGWLALDPTNGRQVSELHVEIGHGRDYADVTPLHGAHVGLARVELDASVSIQRGHPLIRREPDEHPAPVTTRALGRGPAGDVTPDEVQSQ